jgi:CII-binding regulator of phage lambda lysogenization HflD
MSAAAAPKPGVLNFNQIAKAMDVFGQRSEALEMALRCLMSVLRGLSGTSSRRL